MCYQSILNDEFLADAKIDKHIFMLFNANKNVGEVFEYLKEFS